MGTERTDYLMLATDVGATAFDWDKHAAEGEGRPDRRFDIVYDGMSGEYCMAGKIIAKSDAYEGFTLHRIDPETINIDKAELASKVSTAFEKSIEPAEFSLVLFSHFS
ncbi:hypothetical protein KYK29_10205 [Shinella daejeonensis]|uniref:hypothetical protein n=1 Tax=Shinella daejeonensis TaxID=659017 RepID=UPI0020C7F514|nr:hypothetical protein [Shinella daejeonensis]MCP8895307.1 hypothetical protein [Shinella daejeonensis]